MTVEEFSNEFDTLADSYRRFKDFDNRDSIDSLEFNEYEKSIYLTKALEDIVRDLYASKFTADSFEVTEEVRRSLDALVKQHIFTEEDAKDKITDSKYTHTTFDVKEDCPECWYIIYELVTFSSDDACLNGKIVNVYPITHDDYFRICASPFKGPTSRRALRIDSGDLIEEIVSTASIGEYLIRYVSKPEPIVLAKLYNESIDGVTEPQTCKLTTSLHRDILTRAVQLAISSKSIQNNNKATSSSTDSDES